MCVYVCMLHTCNEYVENNGHLDLCFHVVFFIYANDVTVRVQRRYLDLCQTYPSAPLSTQVFHVRRMCKQVLDQYQLLSECCAARDTVTLRSILTQCAAYRQGTVPFVHNPEKDKADQEAAARRKQEVAKRKAYDGRMTRKAKREGKPLDFYLKQGRDPPTHDDLVRIKALPQDQQIPAWRADFGQHCYAFHCATGGCKREKACAFLHTDISRLDPSWLQESTS